MFPDFDLLRSLVVRIGLHGPTDVAVLKASVPAAPQHPNAVVTLVRFGLLKIEADDPSLEPVEDRKVVELVMLTRAGTFFFHVHKDDPYWEAAKARHGAAGEKAFLAIVAEARDLYWRKHPDRRR